MPKKVTIKTPSKTITVKPSKSTPNRRKGWNYV